MPHIASPSRAPEDGHGDSANSGDVRGCVHRDYQDIPVPVTPPTQPVDKTFSCLSVHSW
jgi:hypothetical protein